MSFLGLPAEAWSALGTWATMVVLSVTLFFVYRQVSEASALRRDQTRPFVVVSIDVEQRSVFMLTVENVGSTPAYNVEINFDKPLRSSLKEIEAVRMFHEPIPMLPPGRRFRATWEIGFEVFNDDYPHPLSYEAAVTYNAHDGTSYGPETYILDFRVYEGQAVNLKGVYEIASSMEQLVAEHRKWTKSGRGILAYTIDDEIDERRSSRPFRLRDARRELNENGVLAALRYWAHLLKRRYGLWIR